jgi:hypothetical protein
MHAGQTLHITPDRNALREAERARTTVPSTERPMRLVRALLGQWPRRQSLRACCAHLRAVGPFACSGPRVCLFVCLDSSAVCAAGVGHARARRVQVVLEVEGLFRPWPVRTLHYSKLSAGRKRTIDKVKCKRTLGRTLVESGTRETQPQNHVNVAIDRNRVCRRVKFRRSADADRHVHTASIMQRHSRAPTRLQCLVWTLWQPPSTDWRRSFIRCD